MYPHNSRPDDEENGKADEGLSLTLVRLRDFDSFEALLDEAALVLVDDLEAVVVEGDRCIDQRVSVS